MSDFVDSRFARALSIAFVVGFFVWLADGQWLKFAAAILVAIAIVFSIHVLMSWGIKRKY
mgnify:CR=1 FL=1